jgi:hypothetical protein
MTASKPSTSDRRTEVESAAPDAALVSAFLDDLRSTRSSGNSWYYSSAARHFLLWLDRCRIPVTNVDDTIVNRFAQHRCHCPRFSSDALGNTTARRRDKRGSPDDNQAIDMAWLRPGASVGSRAARGRKARQFKHHSGTQAFQTLQRLHR